MRKWLWIIAVFTASAAAQNLPYTPTPMGAFLGSGGSWTAWNAVLGSQNLGYTPTAIGLYCSTNGTTWQPCNPSSGSATLPFPGIVYATSATGGTVATGAQVQSTLTPAPSGTLALYLANTGSGTSLVDTSGNTHNCTFGTNPPIWNTSSPVPYLTISASANSVLSCPAASINGAQTIEVWYYNRTPSSYGGNGALIGTDANNGTGLQTTMTSVGWGSALEWYNSSNTKIAAAVDRTIGPSMLGVTLGTTPLLYVNGHPVVGYKDQVASSFSSFSSTTSWYIGMLAPNLFGDNFNGDLYAIITYTGIRTASQIAADDAYVRSIMLTPNGFSEVDQTASNRPLLVIDGDSIPEGGGITEQFNQSYPYYESYLLGNNYDTFNVAVGGETAATMVSTYATKVHPLVQDHYNAGCIVRMAGGTNDAAVGTSAATIEASITSYATSVHNDNCKFVWENILPRYTFSTAQQTVATTVNTWALTQLSGATPVIDAIADRAGVPWEATTKANSVAYNSTCTPDGTHPSSFCNQMLAYNTALATNTVSSGSRSFTVRETIPYQILTNAATTQTVNLLQLGPSQKVCGITIPASSGTSTGVGTGAPSGVTTAFAGTGITTVVLTSFGDSGGSSSSYGSPAASLTSTSTVWDGGAPTYVSSSGIVTALITSAAGNLSALTAGSVTVAIQVCTQ